MDDQLVKAMECMAHTQAIQQRTMEALLGQIQELRRRVASLEHGAAAYEGERAIERMRRGP